MRHSLCSLAAVTTLTLASREAGPGAMEVPFEIASNKPYVQVSINGSPKQWFILDTGCGGTSVIAKECADRIGLRGEAEERVHLGAGEGVQVGVSTVPSVTLDLGEVSTKFATLRIFPLGHVAPYEGRPVDGLLGQDFLERHVVEIDYAKNRVRILDPESFVPARGGVSIPITTESGLAVAKGTITVRGKDPIPCRLVIDTGVRATVIFYRPFAAGHGLLDVPGNLLDATVGGGAGGETRGDVGRLEKLLLGSFAFDEPTAIFSRDTVGVLAGTEEDGIIGGELLRRARVTFDYPHQRMILEPYPGSLPPFDYDMSGLFLVAHGNSFERITVQSVTRGTPAGLAGLKPGDEILALDGRRSPKLTLEDARSSFRTPGEHRLEVRRGGKTLHITLIARRLV
ncbi:MAG: aspartyl protease family protein [Candidatus Eiseniibacteriota bacterium]